VPGEGLGLAVVRRILDRHDGDVRLVSTPGQGSRFIVILPRRAGARAASEVQLDENS
jgi:two-component system phosphate regulon sensor histidine kinase PhoR